MSQDWRDFAAILAGGGLITALSGALGYRIRARREEASTRKEAAEALSVETSTARTLFVEVESLRLRLLEIEGRCATLERDNFRLREENQQLADIIPVMSLIAQIMDFDRARKVFDEATDAWVVSSADQGGAFRWVNVAFAAALNLTREEVIATNWRELVLPEFLEATARVEEAAVARPVIHFRNAYRRNGGGTVWMSWFCCPYKDGATLSVVKMRVEQ